MAVYQENWGLTDDLKSEYNIFVSVASATAAEVSDAVGANFVSQDSGVVNAAPTVGAATTTDTPTART